jgi:rubredoxin
LDALLMRLIIFPFPEIIKSGKALVHCILIPVEIPEICEPCNIAGVISQKNFIRTDYANHRIKEKIDFFECIVYGYISNTEKGDPAGCIPPGVIFLGLPDDWLCPVVQFRGRTSLQL